MRSLLMRRERKPAELLLVPMIDIFTVLVTFLLMTAVPILVVHAFLQAKTTGLSDGLETAAIRFLNALAARQAARAQSRLELVPTKQAASA